MEHQRPPLPAWAQLALFVLAACLRATSVLTVSAFRVVLWLAGATYKGWRQVAFFVADRLAMLPTLIARIAKTIHGILPVFWRGLQRVLLPTSVAMLAVGAGIVLHQVDAPAAPADSRVQQERAAASVVARLLQPRTTTLTAKTLGVLRDLLGGPPEAVERGQLLLQKVQPADAPILHTALLRPGRVATADYRVVLRRIGAAVPDHRGRFRGGSKAVDWVAGLVQLRAKGLGTRLERARKEAIMSVSLMRALSRTRHPEAGTTLLRMAYRHGGVFRDECGRLLRALGDHAVPSLVRAGLIDDPQAYRMVRYAGYQLDRINRARPELALKHPSAALVVEMLHAYGEARTESAVKAVVAATDHATPAIREAARWATLRYVSGRKPRAKKRKLNLVGGRRTTRERSLYLTYRQLARHQLAVHYAAHLRATNKLGDLPTDKAVAQLVGQYAGRLLAERLFAIQDSRRIAAQRQAFAKLLALGKNGRGDVAMKAARRALTMAQGVELRDENLARVFYRRAREQARSNQATAALENLSKAIALAPTTSPIAGRSRALRLVVEARNAPPSAARWRLDQAAALAPALPEVLAARTHIQNELSSQTRLVIQLSALSIGGMVALLLFAGHRRRRRRGS